MWNFYLIFTPTQGKICINKFFFSFFHIIYFIFINLECWIWLKFYLKIFICQKMICTENVCSLTYFVIMTVIAYYAYFFLIIILIFFSSWWMKFILSFSFLPQNNHRITRNTIKKRKEIYQHGIQNIPYGCPNLDQLFSVHFGLPNILLQWKPNRLKFNRNQL